MAAIIYVDGHQPSQDEPVGIDVATDGFLDAYVRYSRVDTLSALTPNESAGAALRRRLTAAGKAEDQCRLISLDDAEAIAAVGCIFRYDPAISNLSWTRRHQGQRRYSLCGITHSSSTPRVMDLTAGLLTAPTQSWDALVCASHSIRSAVQSLIDGWSDYLGTRFGTPAPRCPMQFPVIPLGVDKNYFTAITSEAARQRQRKEIGVSDAEAVVLFVGRLNYYAKANPFALLHGMERIADESAAPVRVIFYGYFADEDDEDAFKEAARTICRKTTVTFVIEGDPRFPDGLWAGADIFCSLADNIQESFGLTPVEAMASGLPVIVSDWDGYRDTVRDEIDGYRIPTLTPPAGAGDDIALRQFQGRDGYGEYLAAAAQATAVDLDALVTALGALIKDRDLRRTMGESGRRHVAEHFDWPHIIRAYEDLWDELGERRLHDTELAPTTTGISSNPLRPDPFDMFDEFSTSSVLEDGKFELVVTDWNEAITRIGLKISIFNPSSLIDLEDLPILIAQLEATSPVTTAELAASLTPLPRNKLLRTLVWLAKLGICRYTAPPSR
ncbi:MAG: glycosyltransferase family 4 protein [Proteobacteria bacterium]|nr:glycosyltransferase family 4 protein [Pseudomonadota bacterium]